MRALVEALPPRLLGNDVQTLTLSAGVICRVPRVDERAEDLLAAADATLYEAKHKGRNRVCAAQ
jgi:diguanylate cyclase (GGDEF)-like protein